MKDVCRELYDKFSSKGPVIFKFYAHNGFKADYPLIVKALTDDKELTHLKACSSAMGNIVVPYEYRIEGNPETTVKIEFLDSLNFLKMPLA